MAGPITISVIGDTRSLVGGLNNANTGLGRLGASAGRTGKAIAKGLAIGITGVAAAGAAFIGSSLKSLARIERIGAATDNVIRSTGGIANVTRAHVDELAGTLENLTATEAESITEGANMLLTFTGIRNGVGKTNQIFDQAVGAITDMSRALDKTGGANVDTTKTAVQLGKALNDPIKGVTALAKVGVSFTEDQRAQIKTLVESGKTMGAQKIILAELKKEFGGAGEAFGKTTAGQIELAKHAFGTFGESLASDLLPVLGRLATAATKGLAWLDTQAPAIKAFVADLRADLAPALDKVGQFLSGLEVRSRPVVKFFRENPAVIKTFGIALGVIVGGLVAVTIATTAFSIALNTTGIPLIIIGLAALAAGLVYAYRESSTFRGVVDQVAATTKAFAGFLATEVIPRVVETAQAVGTKLKPILSAVADVFVNDVFPTLSKVVDKFREWRPTIQQAISAIGRIIVVVTRIIGKVLELYAAIAGKVIPVLLRFAGFLIRNVVGAVLTVIGVLIKIHTRIVEFGTAFIDTTKDLIAWVRSVKGKVNEVLGFITGLPGRAKTELGLLAGTLVEKGKDLVGGFLAGVKQKGEELVAYVAAIPGRVKDAIGSIAGGIGDLAGNILGKTTARAVTANSALAKGLLASLKKGEQGLERYLTSINKRVAAAYKKRTGDKLTARQLAGYTKAIRTEVAELLHAASAYAKAAKARRDYAANVKANALSFADITGVGQVGDNGEQTPASIVQGLKDRLNAIVNFNRKIKALANAGLRKDLLDQIISAGVDGGTATAEALVAGGAATIRAANSVQASITKAAGALGQSATDAVLAPLDKDKVIKAANAAAGVIASVLRKRLGLRVEVIAPNVGNGTRGTVKRTRLDLADTTPRRTRVNSDVMDARLGRDSEFNTVRIELTAEQISAVERGRRVTADVRAYKRAGGRP